MKPVEKPNFGNSGTLAAASNSVTQADGTTITLKYHEPPEARKASPRDEWKLFIFKGQDIVDTIDLNARSCWLIGREVAVVDLPAEHPSISKQHAVIQFRYTEKRNEFGDKIGRVKPYLIDLESANGTMLNGEKVPDSRYLELRNKDMVRCRPWRERPHYGLRKMHSSGHSKGSAAVDKVNSIELEISATVVYHNAQGARMSGGLVIRIVVERPVYP